MKKPFVYLSLAICLVAGLTQQIRGGEALKTNDLDELQKEFSEYSKQTPQPIVFYGKVIDDDMQPVTGANISLNCNQYIPSSSTDILAVSDKAGRFSVSGISGASLSILAIEKAGYDVPRSNINQEFIYLAPPGSQAFHPDPNKPFVFYLRKKGVGVDLMSSQIGMSPDLEISGLRDGTVKRVDFTSRKVGNDGQLELSATKPLPGQAPLNWSFHLAISDGGFIEENDEFPFAAPESGYQKNLDFKFEENGQNWTNKLDKNYYIVYGQPAKYGRIHIETSIDTGVRLSYAINPSGSRNLEPK